MTRARAQGAGEALAPAYAILRELEIHRDLRLNFDGFTVQSIRFVLPLLHGISCGAGETSIAAQRFHICDAAIFPDICLELHRTLNVHLLGRLRITWVNFLYQQPLCDALRNLYGS